MRDPYNILGVPQSANKDEIKRAYRKLAKQYHPDHNAGDEAIAEKFKEVSAAYHILGDEERRRQFDTGEINASGQSQNPFANAGAGHGFGGAGFSAHGFEDILREFQEQARYNQTHRTSHSSFGGAERGSAFFSDLFGFGGGRRHAGTRKAKPKPQRGDVIYDLTISFVDAANGMTKQMTLQNGKTLNVKIPAGVRDGQKIRLSGQGGVSAASGGDAFIRIAIAPHPWFRRDDHDIYLELPITLDEAVLGGKVSVPTIRGEVTLTLPEGISAGKKLRLKGKGIQTSKKAGDQFVIVRIVMPEKIDDDLKAKITDWRQRHRYSVRDDMTGKKD